MWTVRHPRTARLALPAREPASTDLFVVSLPTDSVVACAWAMAGLCLSALVLGLAPGEPIGVLLADAVIGLG